VFFKVLEKWKTRISRPGSLRMRRVCHPGLRWAKALVCVCVFACVYCACKYFHITAADMGL